MKRFFALNRNALTAAALAATLLMGAGVAMADSTIPQAEDYLSQDAQQQIKTWLDGRHERAAVREQMAGGQLEYRLMPCEMYQVRYLPSEVMEEMDLPLAYRDGSRLGFYGRNVVLVVPSTGELIDVLPDALLQTREVATRR